MALTRVKQHCDSPQLLLKRGFHDGVRQCDVAMHPKALHIKLISVGCSLGEHEPVGNSLANEAAGDARQAVLQELDADARDPEEWGAQMVQIEPVLSKKTQAQGRRGKGSRGTAHGRAQGCRPRPCDPRTPPLPV